ncbi:MAG: succinyl transferase OpgC, partial [Proteobacteria bacterium]|nr:succinyl transferase OpgC [Pseudomonadota bacterium]
MKRRNELDALRGIFLLVMAGTHLPTALNSAANQPLGYVSAAEGFVFLSAFLVGSIYAPLLSQRGFAYVRERLWKRARKLYGYHLLLLLFVFTVVVGVTEWSGSHALRDYLLVFFHHPAVAVAASPLFMYQPPLLDILPMYIVFLLLSPALLRVANHRGWLPILGGSGLLWLFAQWGGGHLLYQGVSALGMPLPLDAYGAFNWFSWQLVWVAGLWLGSVQNRPDGVVQAIRAHARPVMAAALAVSLVFLLWRHHVG